MPYSAPQTASASASAESSVLMKGCKARAAEQGSPGRAVSRAAWQGRYWVQRSSWFLLRVDCERSLEGSPDDRVHALSDALPGSRRTPLWTRLPPLLADPGAPRERHSWASRSHATWTDPSQTRQVSGQARSL